MTGPISVPQGGRKDGSPVIVKVDRPDYHDFLDGNFPESFTDWKLPKIEGVEFADFSTELDAPLTGDMHVYPESIMGMELPWMKDAGTEVQGRTLREIIKARAFIDPLVLAYRVEGPGDEYKTYLLNGELVGTPEGAEARGIPRLAFVMRMSAHIGLPGVYLALIQDFKPDAQQFILYPDISRVVAVSIGAKKIGPAIGLKFDPRLPRE
jgi:hypothetical protein